MRLVKILFLVLLSMSMALQADAGDRNERTKWWTRDRFGMFIHFGVYSLAARHEKVILKEKMTQDEYAKYFEMFNPDLLDARAWAKRAKATGMKYAVLTAKHHDGFCLFDSKYTDYKSTKTPFGRDIVREFADACHEAGVRCGFYYSLLDWHHPDYTMDYWYPGCKGKTVAELAELNKVGEGGFFGIGVDSDLTDCNMQILYMGQGGLGIGDRDYYVDPANAESRTVNNLRRGLNLQ